MTYQNESGRYDNVVQDVIGSGILATLTPRRQTILLMLAGMSKTDSASERHRTAFAYQGDWAKKLGITRQHINKNFKWLVSAGVIAFMGKRQPEGRRKGQKPANYYLIPDFDSLCELAYQLGKKARPERPQNENLQKGRKEWITKSAVRQGLQVVDDNVSPLSDKYVSPLSDSRSNLLSPLSDTEVEGKDLEVELESGNSVFQDLELGITDNGKEPETARAGAPTATPDGVIQESGEGVSESVKPERTTGQWIDELRVVATGERERTIRLAIQDHGGYINGERVPITVDAGVAFLENRFEQMGMVQ